MELGASISTFALQVLGTAVTKAVLSGAIIAMLLKSTKATRMPRMICAPCFCKFIDKLVVLIKYKYFPYLRQNAIIIKMNKKTVIGFIAFASLILIYAAYADDTTAPVISLQTPADGASSFLNRTNISYTVIDASALLWCRAKMGDVIQDIVKNASANATNYFYDIYTPNGSITWAVECSDNASNIGSASRTLNVSYDNTAPTIVLNISASNVSSEGQANFSYVPTDMQAGVKECRLYLNESEKKSVINPKNGSENFFLNVPLEKGVYTWSINCTDTAGNERASQIATFDLREVSNLTIDLISPPDNHLSNTRIFDFQFIPRSNEFISFCGIYFNNTINLTTTKVVQSGLNSFKNIKLSEGDWKWVVECRTLGGLRKNSTTRTAKANLEVLISTFMNISLLNPSDNLTHTTGIVDFSFVPTSILNLKKCELVTNSSTRATNYVVTIGGLNTFSEVNLADGVWSWNVRCVNKDNNLVLSPTRNIYVSRVVTEEPLPPTIEEPSPLEGIETILDRRALAETLPRQPSELSAVQVLLIVIILSTFVAAFAFIFSQKTYRNAIIGFVKPPKVYAKEQLKFYIDKHLRRGISEERIKRHLQKFNWKEKDIDETFAEVYAELIRGQKEKRRQPLEPPPMPPKKRKG